jgi:hypothetical protein
MEHGSPETSSSESSISASSPEPATPTSRVETMAPSMSQVSCGGAGSIASPVIAPSAFR